MPRSKNSERGLRPRARRSSVKLVSRDIGLMMRSATNVPAPCRWVSKPSSTRPAIALRTVTRDSSSTRARSRSLGKA